MSLASLADLKGYLDLHGDNIDDELQRLLDMASALVETYVARSLEQATFTERRSGTCSDVLLVRNGPVSAVSSLTIDGRAIAPSVGTAAGYYFEGDAVYLLGGLTYSRGRKNIAITYTGGYTPIPADLAHATIEIAAQAFKEKDWVGIQSKALAGETTSFLRAGVPDSARDTLNRYRRLHACD